MIAKRLLILLTVAGLSAVALFAQFGGIINKAKAKIDKANEKAKPVVTRAEKAADSFGTWSPEDEQEIGEASAAKLIAMFGAIDNPKLEQYVNLVGNAVARRAPRQLPYRFGILGTEIVGAYALPGGFVFVTKTALEAMNSESELAGVLAHEIIHAAERHLETEIRGKKTTAWAVEEGKARASREPDFIRKRADTLLKEMFDMQLSKDKEDGADTRGAKMAADAGYAPDGLLTFLRTLSSVNARPDADKRLFGQMLSTHPSFESRIANLETLAQGGPQGKTLETRYKAALK